LSILSYAGKIVVGIATDQGLVPDPEAILEDFIDELEQLGRWERPYQPKIETQSSEPESKEGYHRCKATTKGGKQCKNRAKPGAPFCHIHLDTDIG
jgi:hypothetical protein